MFYYLFNYLDRAFDFPGAGMFNYISFRATLAFLIALVFSTLIGKRIIAKLQELQIGETIRDLDLEGEITGYDLTPMAVKEDAYASQTKLTITIRVRYSNRVNPEEDFEV